MPGDRDDENAPRRGAVRPPPSDAPSRVEVPRMEPPPPSLEAMVQSNRQDARPDARGSWLLWLALFVVAVAVTAYVAR